MCAFGLRVHVLHFTFFFIFLFFCALLLTLGDKFYCYKLCMYCSHTVYTVHILKNIKNGSHNTIYTFKYYFATVFSVFSFQFSATISSIQTHPIKNCGRMKQWQNRKYFIFFIQLREKNKWIKKVNLYKFIYISLLKK